MLDVSNVTQCNHIYVECFAHWYMYKRNTKYCTIFVQSLYNPWKLILVSFNFVYQSFQSFIFNVFWWPSKDYLISVIFNLSTSLLYMLLVWLEELLVDFSVSVTQKLFWKFQFDQLSELGAFGKRDRCNVTCVANFRATQWAHSCFRNSSHCMEQLDLFWKQEVPHPIHNQAR